MRQVFNSNRKLSFSNKLRVGVVCGGTSSERKISLKSGRAVRRALKDAGFHVQMMDPARKKTWMHPLKNTDVVFLALHGVGGEDGTIQQFLERKKTAYVGAGPRESLLAFDKLRTKKVFKAKGISTAAWKILKGPSAYREALKFKTPFFVKPLQEGSSIGVYEVRDLEAQWGQVHASLKKYGVLMIERTVSGPEYTVGILGKEALPVVELRPRNAFYDYHAKYTRGMTDYLVPAPISKALKIKLQRLALRVHQVLGLRDLSRVDFKVDAKTRRPYVLEANSIPGFTEFSLLPKAAQCRGISFPQLCEKLVKMAYQRSVAKRGVYVKA